MNVLDLLKDPILLIKTVGLIGIYLIIFAESGLLIGFFLPGDSLLFTAGFLASGGLKDFQLPLVPLLIGCFLAAVIGDSVGYTFGRRIGRPLFEREDSGLFKKKYITQAQAFYDKHGSKTIVLARFVPIVRTFAPIVAGAAEMKYQTFVVFNVVGGFLWSCGVALAGYFLGNIIPDVDKYLLPIIIVIVLISVAPAILHIARDAEMRSDIMNSLRKLFTRQAKSESE
ncbi:MAG: VTT domain-containing protein [Anaerolineae bacterium]|nr:VTT domain-containing protein [Anaerolineae bacterium]